MRRDEMAIGLVLRVPVAVIDDGEDLLAVVLPDDRGIASAVGTILVDVVAGVEDEIKPLIGDSAKRREIAGLVVIAAAYREAKSLDDRIGGWGGPGATDLTDLAAGMEAVPVFASRLKPLHFDVHAVAKLGSGNLDTLLFNRPESLVVFYFPTDFDLGGGHAAAVERIGSEPRPQHDTVRPGVA